MLNYQRGTLVKVKENKKIPYYYNNKKTPASLKKEKVKNYFD